MSGTSVMRALVAVAAFTCTVVAHPYPACEVCDAVSEVDLEALSAAGKYLCCDLTCETDPVAGCGVFGLSMVCKACYDGDDTPAYDDPPIDGGSDSTPAPVATVTTPAPVATVMTPAPVATVTTPAPVATTPAPVATVMTPAPTDAPIGEVEGIPETQPPASGDDDDSSFSYAMTFEVTPSPSALCTACDAANSLLTTEDWREIEDAGYELVCDPDCFDSSTLEGCGAFGLDIECRAVSVDTDTSGYTGTGTGTGTGIITTSIGTGTGTGTGTITTSIGTGTGTGTGTITTSIGTGTGTGTGIITTSIGTGTGTGTGTITTSIGTGTGTTSSVSCSAEEEAQCADISPAQQEALDSYDNGGKVIVCDPTCIDGVTSPIHCNYFGLGPMCRGCGSCSTCTPCP